MRSARPARGGGRNRDLLATAALFVIALLPRLYVALAWAREPVWDGHYYDYGARRIAAGLGYSDDVMVAGHAVWHPWAHYPVGYSGLLGGIYRVFGSGPHVATVANAIMGALLVALVHRLARYAISPGRARLAGLLAALSPGLIVYSALLMTEPVAALGLALAAWLGIRDRASHPWRGVALAGLVIGLTTLVRPQTLVCAPALALLAYKPSAARSVFRAGARLVGLALLGSVAAMAMVLPWTARNCRVMDGCALVSTNGGWNLAIGASPHATGRFGTLRASDGCKVVTGQVQQDRCWMETGKGWIAADPWRWIGLIPKKLGETFDHESFPMGYLGEADPAAWPEARKAAGRELLTTAHRWMLALAPLAFVAWPGRARGRALLTQLVTLTSAIALCIYCFMDDTHPFWLSPIGIVALAVLPLWGKPRQGGVLSYIAFVIASVIATHAVFFGEDRYHMVLTPLCCILVAAALRRSEPPEARAVG